MTPRLVLVGPPGCGKTTVGRLVAERLVVPFVDTDALVEQAAGKTVFDIFIDDGEAAFRALERAAVRDALDTGGVVALGGGAVLDAATRADLVQRAAGRVVALGVELGDAVKRVGLARDRPLLVEAPRARMAATLRERAPLYAEVAAATIETSGREPQDVAEEVLEWLSSR